MDPQINKSFSTELAEAGKQPVPLSHESRPLPRRERKDKVRDKTRRRYTFMKYDFFDQPDYVKASLPFSGLPVGVRGISSRTTMCFGTMNRAIRSAQCA